MTAVLRLLGRLGDWLMATPPTTWSSSSYGLGPTDSRPGGASPVAARPGSRTSP